jgi:hypothetical protein
MTAFVLAHGHEMLHADSDFDPFEAPLGLRLVDAAGSSTPRLKLSSPHTNSLMGT